MNRRTTVCSTASAAVVLVAMLSSTASAQSYTWTELSTGTDSYLAAVQFLDADEGWVSGVDATLLHTRDGGRKWERLSVPNAQAEDGFNTVQFSSSADGWIGGLNLALRTLDGGSTWEGPVDSKATELPFYNALYALSSTVAWAAGAQECTDAGLEGLACATLSRLAYDSHAALHVTVQQAETPNIFNDVFMANASSGYAVGSNGTLYRIENADTDTGVALKPQDAGVGTYLNAVFMLDDQTAWIAGDDGIILHTANGRTWTAQDTGASVDLEDVAFVDADEGYAVGAGGTILHTLDGGRNWTGERSPVSSGLKALAIAGHDVFAVGASGVALKRIAAADDAGAGGETTARRITPSACSVPDHASGNASVAVTMVAACACFLRRRRSWS